MDQQWVPAPGTENQLRMVDGTGRPVWVDPPSIYPEVGEGLKPFLSAEMTPNGFALLAGEGLQVIRRPDGTTIIDLVPDTIMFTIRWEQVSPNQWIGRAGLRAICSIRLALGGYVVSSFPGESLQLFDTLEQAQAEAIKYVRRSFGS